MSITGWERLPPGHAKRAALEQEIPRMQHEAATASYRFAGILILPFGLMFWHALGVPGWRGVAGCVVSALGIPAYLATSWVAGRKSYKGSERHRENHRG